VVRQVLRRRNHRRPHLPHAVTVDSIGHAFGVDNHDHHHRVRNFDSYSNSGQESATHVDRPRLIRGQLSCFLLKCDIRLHSIALLPLLELNPIITHRDPSPTFWRSVPEQKKEGYPSSFCSAGVTLKLPRGGSPLPSVASQITVGPMPLETSPVPSA
jgi:hypothetical protein